MVYSHIPFFCEVVRSRLDGQPNCFTESATIIILILAKYRETDFTPHIRLLLDCLYVDEGHHVDNDNYHYFVVALHNLIKRGTTNVFEYTSEELEKIGAILVDILYLNEEYLTTYILKIILVLVSFPSNNPIYDDIKKVFLPILDDGFNTPLAHNQIKYLIKIGYQIGDSPVN